jgi:hypothetical protein
MAIGIFVSSMSTEAQALFRQAQFDPVGDAVALHV